MLKTTKERYMFFLALLCCLFLQINAIYQPCYGGSICPANSFCGFRSYCVCNTGYILNCSTPAQNITNNPLIATITNGYSYFVIEPQSLFEYVKFTIQLSTT